MTDLDVPIWLGDRALTTSSSRALTGADGSVVARVSVAGRLVQQQMVQQARQVAPALREVDDQAWFDLFTRAGARVRRELEAGRHDRELDALSAATGLPRLRVLRGVAAVADHLDHLDAILSAQSPDGSLSAYRTGVCGRPWRWLPAGSTCMVRVPANFPTIMIEWLQVLAARRPTLVNTSDRDPFVAGIFVAALYAEGLPPGAVSVCHGDAPTWLRLADQVVWPGEDAPPDLSPARLKTYHFGRSKTVLPDADPAPETWDRLARLAFQGSGRLCTNMSALAVVGDRADAASAARRLAEAFAAYPVLPLADPAARVPAFPARRLADDLVRLLRREIAAGAVDVTAATGLGRELLVELDGTVFLRPTVLLVEPGSALFGMELPFPCTVVAPVTRERVAAVCSPSLIVSVVGDDPELVERLLAEPGITKVFSGGHVDRAYEPVDPQEGYLADFLFQKKALHTGA
ncbi:hypothetical protein [Catellatospora tritici]|uniref:hypothetical protein n=1 Tax=Catellatospora tritici TaxID=2851566 RepID=UPI001C2D5EFD|nr:hypothetical protein [Catellatospora tritici]MBV1850718.1 hypothetical protein [Catellatospora tritici]MBV1850971.1 hypothetical protein [Catellatospora tritici]